MVCKLKELAVQLFDAGALRIGDIEAKLGRRTPIYFDLRVVVSHPKIVVGLSRNNRFTDTSQVIKSMQE